nr:hypothetical protein [Tanacetum cinerariifolium]
SVAYLGKVRRTSWDFRKTSAQIGCAAYFLGKEKIFGFRLPENGERMVLYDNPMGSLNNVIDNQIFNISSDESYASSVKMYLNDEEDDGDSMAIPQTLSEEIRTKIDNTRKDHREEDKAMFMSVNKVIKLMLSIATNMSSVVENEIGKE